MFYIIILNVFVIKVQCLKCVFPADEASSVVQTQASHLVVYVSSGKVWLACRGGYSVNVNRPIICLDWFVPSLRATACNIVINIVTLMIHPCYLGCLYKPGQIQVHRLIFEIYNFPDRSICLLLVCKKNSIQWINWQWGCVGLDKLTVGLDKLTVGVCIGLDKLTVGVYRVG